MFKKMFAKKVPIVASLNLLQVSTWMVLLQSATLSNLDFVTFHTYHLSLRQIAAIFTIKL